MSWRLRMRSSHGLTVAAAAVALSLCACTGEDPAPVAQTPTVGADAKPSRVEGGWRSSGLLPFSAVRNVGGTAVLYTRRPSPAGGQEIWITALDPVTGEVLWQDEASPAKVSRGIPIGVAEVNGHVTYFRDVGGTGNLLARLVIADARTGNETAVSEPRYFGSPALPCGDGGTAACSRALDPATQQVVDLRIGDRPRMAPSATTAGTAVPETARAISSGGLIDLGIRAPERIGRVEQGRLRWSRPITDLFGPGATTDTGWSLRYLAAADEYVGSVGRTAWRSGTITLEQTSTAAFSASDGTPLWRDAGSQNGCLAHLVVAPPAVTPDDQDSPTGSVQPLRCRYTGTLVEKTKQGSGITVTLERFDIRTGKALWSAPLGAAPALAGTTDADVPLVDDTHAFVDTGTHRLVVDLMTGATTPATATTRVWCRPDSKIDYKVAVDINGNARSGIIGDGLAFPCTLDGEPLDTPGDRVPSNVAAVFANGLRLYATPTAVVAHRQS
jgi:hypothetical protein